MCGSGSPSSWYWVCCTPEPSSVEESSIRVALVM